MEVVKSDGETEFVQHTGMYVVELGVGTHSSLIQDFLCYGMTGEYTVLNLLRGRNLYSGVADVSIVVHFSACKW